jgi:membrane protein required for colicin V production
MPEANALTWLDLIVAILCTVFILRGAWTGFMRQLAAFLALAGSYVVAAQYTAVLIPYTKRLVDNPKLVFLLSFICLFFAAALVFSFLGRVLHRLMQITLLGWFNRLLGMLLGALKAALLASLLYMVLASTLSATNPVLSKSLSAPYLRQGAQLLQSLINDPKLRAYFTENTPAIPLELMDPENQRRETTTGKETEASHGTTSAPANRR